MINYDQNTNIKRTIDFISWVKQVSNTFYSFIVFSMNYILINKKLINKVNYNKY